MQEDGEEGIRAFRTNDEVAGTVRWKGQDDYVMSLSNQTRQQIATPREDRIPLLIITTPRCSRQPHGNMRPYLNMLRREDPRNKSFDAQFQLRRLSH